MSVADVLAQMNPAGTATRSSSKGSAKSSAISLPQALLPGSGSATAVPTTSGASTGTGSGSDSKSERSSSGIVGRGDWETRTSSPWSVVTLFTVPSAGSRPG